MGDFGLSNFKLSPLGRRIAPIILANADNMHALALGGEAPVKALDQPLSHLVPDGVRTQENNKHIGRWVYEIIGTTEFETTGREVFDGVAFESGATFRLRNEPMIRRREPRGGVDEFPIMSRSGTYQLVRSGLSPEKRTKLDYAVQVRRLSEAVHLLNLGYHIRMGRRGVRPSLIAKDSLIIQHAI